MNTVILNHSTNKNKKYSVKYNNKTINFGAKGYEDYTTHKDNKRKESYIQRHKPKE